MRREFFFDHALLPEGWRSNVRVSVQGGVISQVSSGGAQAEARAVRGVAIPGVPNVHSHAFQRGMAGLAERRGPASDSFWTWREVMYRFLSALTPDDVEAIAAYAYMEMLEAGFTAVGEFHYLHHGVGGQPYADLGEMAARIAAAAVETGIGLTLLPSLYVTGGFDHAPPSPGQARFINDVEHFCALVERTQAIARGVPHANVGIAPHSLRAAPPEALSHLLAVFPHGPVHIHAAEQPREVAECVASLGARPVEWLLDHAGVDARWCLIHATHMTEDETKRLARSGAVAGLCPLTEASLGDGIFNGRGYLAEGGRFAVGSDSNIQIDAAAELRQLEYAQRLAHGARNVMALEEGESTGRRLVSTALAGGAQALQRRCGALAPGCFADIVVLDADLPELAVAREDGWLDAWIFVLGRAAVQSVIAGGELVVEYGRHGRREPIVRRYHTVVRRLMAA